MSPLRRVLLCCCLGAGTGMAQEGAAFDCRVVPDAAVFGLAVSWPRGLLDDPPEQYGLARVLLECRLQRARLVAPQVTESGGEVDGDSTVAVVVVPSAAAGEAVRFVAAMLDDGLPGSDDGWQLATARAALLADDDAFVWPGAVLGNRVRAHFFAGQAAARPLGGDPEAMQRLPTAAVRQALAAANAVGPPALVGLGACTPEVVAACERLLAGWPRPTMPSPRAASVPSTSAGRSLRSEPHPRIDAPFVAAGFALAAATPPECVLAMGVARLRAARAFQPRRAEGGGRTPFVWWSWLHQEPVVVVLRRGRDPRRLLPGERAADSAAEVAATAAEIDALLADLRQREPSVAERDEVLALLERAGGDRTAALAATAAHEAAAWLGARVRRTRRGIDAAACALVTPARAHAVLRETLAAERAFWHALVPLPRAGYGYSPR